MEKKYFKTRKPAEKFAERVQGKVSQTNLGDYLVQYSKVNNLCTICRENEIENISNRMCISCFNKMQYAKNRPERKENVSHKSQNTKEIERLLKSGFSQSEIAKKFGISRQRVFSIKKDMEVDV